MEENAKLPKFTKPVCKYANCKTQIYCKNLCQKHYMAQRYKQQRSKYLKMAKESYQRRKEEIKVYRKKYYENNKKQINKKRREWRKATESERKKITNSYLKKRRKEPQFKLKERIRTRLYLALKGIQKPTGLKEALGCSIETLKKHLESQFQPGMSWNNYGQWHIDHIKPLSSFDLTSKDQYIKACNYKNLQPLWGKENIRKGAKYEKTRSSY